MTENCRFYYSELTGDIYLAKRKKDGSASSDKRPLTDKEVYFIIESYLRRNYNETGKSGLTVSKGNVEIMDLTLLDIPKE